MKSKTTLSDRLNAIRAPKPPRSIASDCAATFGILILGIALGVFSKWLDGGGLNDYYLLYMILGGFDLVNVFTCMGIWLVMALAISTLSRSPLKGAVNAFVFFAGMCASYHLYSVLVLGFNPRNYMMIWYAITLVSPLMAVGCWYARGESWISIVLDSLILAVIATCCFSFGLIYIYLRGGLYTPMFVASVIILYRNPKQTAISLIAGFIIAIAMSPVSYLFLS